MTSPAMPIDPVAAILDAFRTHDVVALCDGGHGCEQAYAFRVSLIRDPRFAEAANDIVVECGNSLYQPMMDRFISGEDVPETELRQAWQNTTQPHAVWDTPVFEGLFREVRAVNASLPKDRRLRVLLGDPPIDWSKISNADEHRAACDALPDRDGCPAEIISHEVLAKGRRALVVYGGMHLLRSNPYWSFKDREEAERVFDAPANTIVGLLERQRAKVWSVWSPVDTDLADLQADVRSWAVPSLAVIRDTLLGEASFRAYYPHKMLRMRDGVTEQIGVDPVRSAIMQEQFDAVLYLGPPKNLSWSRVSPELLRDPSYLRMRSERATLLGMGNPRPLPSPALEQTLRRAIDLAGERRHGRVTPAHLLLSLTEDPDAAHVMRACGVDLDALKARLVGHLDAQPMSPGAKGAAAAPTEDYERAVECAIAHVRKLPPRRLTGADILVALLQDDSPAAGFLREQEMTRLDAVSFLAHGVAKTANTDAKPSAGSDRPGGAAKTCRVLLLNDDYTPMDFVVHVLEHIFGKSLDQARQTMLDVHRQGSTVCGLFERPVAEAKAAAVIAEARRYNHPLRCQVEPD